MQVVILAGGLGTRLSPLTHEIPKPMIRINGMPFIEHQIRLLRNNGFSDFLLCIRYLAKQFKDYFGDGSQHGVRLSYSTEEQPLGTGGALKNAEDALEKNFILLNGDTYLPIDYQNVVNYFLSHRLTGVVVAYENKERLADSNLRLEKGNSVTAYSKQPAAGMTHLDAGVYVFNKKVLSLIPMNAKVSLEEDVFPKLIRKKELQGYPTSQRFYDIGTPERLSAFKAVVR
jgi:NDP-sugar pyrophosphorylase family protein